MAAVESLGSTESFGSADLLDATQWIVVRGTLTASDLVPLLDRTAAAEPADVALDLLSLDDLTPGGCWTIRNLGEDLWRHGRLLTVLFPSGGAVADALHSSGTIEHPCMTFWESPIDSR